VRRAEEHLTPSVPEGASLFAVKKALVRIFRFLWREQAAFNALALEAFRRERQEWEGRLASLRETVERELAISQRRAAVQDARFLLLERPATPRAAPDAGGSVGSAQTEIPPAVYSLFEERFPRRPGEDRRRPAVLPAVPPGRTRAHPRRGMRKRGVPAAPRRGRDRGRRRRVEPPFRASLP
jgi:hypothetical protein